MNRAERRRQAKLTGSSVAKDPIISMKKSDIDRIKREAADEATETAMEKRLEFYLELRWYFGICRYLAFQIRLDFYMLQTAFTQPTGKN